MTNSDEIMFYTIFGLAILSFIYLIYLIVKYLIPKDEFKSNNQVVLHENYSAGF